MDVGSGGVAGSSPSVSVPLVGRVALDLRRRDGVGGWAWSCCGSRPISRQPEIVARGRCRLTVHLQPRHGAPIRQRTIPGRPCTIQGPEPLRSIVSPQRGSLQFLEVIVVALLRAENPGGVILEVTLRGCRFDRGIHRLLRTAENGVSHVHQWFVECVLLGHRDFALANVRHVGGRKGLGVLDSLDGRPPQLLPVFGNVQDAFHENLDVDKNLEVGEVFHDTCIVLT